MIGKGQLVLSTPVTYRSPFTLSDGKSELIESPTLSVNPRDEVFRRFSDPAADDDRKMIRKHVQYVMADLCRCILAASKMKSADPKFLGLQRLRTMMQ